MSDIKLETEYSQIINSTYTSWRDSLEGYYFYDAVKQAWFQIIKSTFIFVSFEYTFGARWATRHHKIALNQLYISLMKQNIRQ